MIGQGGPKASRAPLARFTRAMPWLCRAALLLIFYLAGTPSSRVLAEDVNLQLRFAWGGGTERVWHGSVRLSEGNFSELQALGIEADEPGSIWLSGKGIEIQPRSLRAYDGIDVRVTADLNAKLSITLSDEPDESAKPIEIPLRTLVSQSHNTTLDAFGNRLLVTRSPGDRLRIEFDRDNLVFGPGDPFQFAIAVHLLEQTAPGMRYQAQITTSPGGQRVWSQEYESGAEGTETTIEIRVPEEEGVYDLTIVAMQPRVRLRMAKTLVERKVQFVVIDKKPQDETAPASLTKVVEINPMNPRWWDRFASLPLVPGLRKGVGNGDAANWEHPKLGPLVQLGTGGAGNDISWEAYPLPISTPGQSHVLEIEYPTDVPQALGISVVEPNAAGAVTPIGLDSGVYVSDEEAENAPQMAKHRVVFWPRTKTPLLLITNRRQGSRAVYGKITVLSASHSQFGVRALTRAEGGDALPPAFPGNQRPERLWAGYLDRPLFAENFSASEALDSASHRSLDDWTTFYQGGTRLVKYLKHVGYNGLMISSFADGSTIYPSELLQPTPRYDNGVFFASGQDPRRKDGLELLYRLFDREGLTLIPALQFASPLPELEALRREGGPQSAGLEWIGAEGTTWSANHPTHQGLAPYYNVLNPRVQEVMLKVAREISARYAHHPSFGGLSLQLSADGYAQLPGDEWGFDDQTIARFERDTKARVPGAGPQRFEARAKYLSGAAHSVWLEWRAGVLADFHRRLETEVVARRAGAKLYLAGGTMMENRQTQFRLRPSLPRRAKLDDALIELGIRTQNYREDPSIVLLRPQLLKPNATPLTAQAAGLEVILAPGEMDRLFALPRQPGSLFYHEPQKARLASFDAKSPFGPANTYTWLVAQMTPSGDRNRRRFVHSLATLDSQSMFDGGWLLALGQEDSLKDLLSVYRLLPAEHFDPVPGRCQPVTVRTLTRGRQTYIYLVNDSSWDANVTIALELPVDCKMEKLGESRGIGPLVRTSNGASCKVTLRPFDLVAARLTSGNVRVRNCEVTVSDQVRQNLQRRIQDLGARVAALGNPQPIGVLENPNFELPRQRDQIAGWNVTADAQGSVSIDAQQKHSGLQSLKLISTGQKVSVQSAPFEPPNTGRLAVELWLRTTPRAQLPVVKIALEGQVREGKFEPYGEIPANGANASSPGDWVRYSFPIDDVPSEGLSNLSVRLELLSAGEVWVDDVQVFDLSFSDVERTELSKLITLANVKLEAGELGDCSRLLEGYWPQFLVANVPLTQTPLAQRPRSARLIPAAPIQKKPSVLENLNKYLPRLQR